MKLQRVRIIKAITCGGLLDGLTLSFSDDKAQNKMFDPICIIGPNGSGKSQFLQIIAEIFQSIYFACVQDEEQAEGNSELEFEIEYSIISGLDQSEVDVRVSRFTEDKSKPEIKFQIRTAEEWVEIPAQSDQLKSHLPAKVIAYTSGDNETLSLPFLVSRNGYAQAVRERALPANTTKRIKSRHEKDGVKDTRLQLVDYSTHLEVLVANLLASAQEQRKAIMQDTELERLHSFRCIVQLAHNAVPKAPAKARASSGRKGVQLTAELESYLTFLKNSATCYSYEESSEQYIFDFFVDEETRKAIKAYWDSPLDLYSAFHKLAMLNDLALSKATRERFKRETKERSFAARLPEPQDEDKVFRFERLRFSQKRSGETVDYVALSDGEHQLIQVLGIFCMACAPGTLFLLDEPESHSNPQWRTLFISRMKELPTDNGDRTAGSKASLQECIISTHAPFIPSDMRKERVFIFSKEEGKTQVSNPFIETYGTTFDTIIEECFGVRPPISKDSLDHIQDLLASQDVKKLELGISKLGPSVERSILVDKLKHLRKSEH